MGTFGELVDDVHSFLYSQGTVRDKYGVLKFSIGSGDMTLTVLDGALIDRGILQVDDELMLLSAVDRGTGVATILQRALYGTVAAAHLAGALVTSNPRWPRKRVMDEVNNTVLTLYPDLFQVKSTTLTARAQVAYELPADCESIVSVTCEDIGPSKRWVPVTRYQMDRSADTDAFPSGRSLDVFAGIPVGRKLRVTYRASFHVGATVASTFADMGVDERWRDLIRFGAAARLLPSIDPGRLQVDSIEAGQRAQVTGTSQYTSGNAVARTLLQLHKMRVQEERDRLLREYPSRVVMQG